MTKADRNIAIIVLVAIAVSIVHYTDNYTAYEAYPRSDTIPNPSAAVVGGAWFFFTAFALAGLWFLWHGRHRAAGISLAVYSGSGLVGIGHYLAGGTGDFPWWRHAHIVADITLGIAVFASAIYLVRSQPDYARAAGRHP
jgi:VanZ family protein